jgi:hypothetical protein
MIIDHLADGARRALGFSLQLSVHGMQFLLMVSVACNEGVEAGQLTTYCGTPALPSAVATTKHT